MSSVVFATVCLIFLGGAVIGVTGFVLGYSTGRDRERARKSTESFDKVTNTMLELAKMQPPAPPSPIPTHPMGQGNQVATPRIVERPVQSGIFLGDDPILDDGLDENGDSMLTTKRHTQNGVAESIPMNF